MNSRPLLIAIVIVLLIIVGVGLFFLFSGPKAAPSGTPSSGQTGSLPSAGTQTGSNSSGTSAGSTPTGTMLGKNFGIISTDQIIDYSVNAANAVTAVKQDGTIIQIASGKTTVISSIVMPTIQNAGFSYDGKKVLVSFGDPSNPQASVFDIAAKKWSPLPAGLQSPAWSPVDYRIAYLKSGAQGTETLATIDASKANPAPVSLLTVHMQDLALAWPTKNQIALYTKPSMYVAGSAWIYDLQKTALTTIASEVPGLAMAFNASWTSSAPIGLAFSDSPADFNATLSLVNITGAAARQLKLITLPSKCLFASMSAGTSTVATPYLFCGGPRDQATFTNAHLPDDYNQMALFTSDDVYRINLQSGSIDTVFNDSAQSADVSDMKLFNGTLFFINRYNQELYGIGLMTM